MTTDLTLVKGFIFDADGTLILRDGSGFKAIPGATEVLTEVRATGRQVLISSNNTRDLPDTIAKDLQAAGLTIGAHEVITPISTGLRYLSQRHSQAEVGVFAPASTKAYLARAGVHLAVGAAVGTAAVILVLAEVGQFLDLLEVERACSAVRNGASFLCGSRVPTLAGAHGPLYSRGAFVTAIIAFATGSDPVVLGKPSSFTVEHICEVLDLAPSEMAVVGDDVDLDIALGSGQDRFQSTVLVRTGISAQVDLERTLHRPDIVLETVADVLPLLGR